MPITLTIGWWIIPFIAGFIGILATFRSYWAEMYDYETMTKKDLAILFTGFWAGIPWGIYGICRAIFN